MPVSLQFLSEFDIAAITGSPGSMLESIQI